jgi:hypothetical protein
MIDTEDRCHCGASYEGSDHCPRCFCEQYEADCGRRPVATQHSQATSMEIRDAIAAAFFWRVGPADETDGAEFTIKHRGMEFVVSVRQIDRRTARPEDSARVPGTERRRV